MEGAGYPLTRWYCQLELRRHALFRNRCSWCVKKSLWCFYQILFVQTSVNFKGEPIDKLAFPKDIEAGTRHCRSSWRYWSGHSYSTSKKFKNRSADARLLATTVWGNLMNLHFVRNIWERMLEQLLDIVGTVSGAEWQIYITEGSNLKAK